MKLTPEKTAQLTGCLPESREELIEGCRPLVILIVQQVIRKWPALKRVQDDLLGAGFLGLTTAVENLLTIDVKNPSGYIGLVTRYHILNEARENRQWKVSKQHSLDDFAHLFMQKDPNFDEIDLHDLLDACCLTQQSRDIANLRIQGYEVKEITEQLNISRKIFDRELQKLKRRLTTKISNLRKTDEIQRIL